MGGWVNFSLFLQQSSHRFVEQSYHESHSNTKGGVLVQKSGMQDSKQ